MQEEERAGVDGVASRLVEVALPREPRGAVVVLHGGAARRDRTAVSPTQLSVLRMVPIARQPGPCRPR